MEQNNESVTTIVEPERVNSTGIVRRTWEESQLVWRTAFPTMLFRLSTFGVQVVTHAFIGHISKLEFAAFAIVQAISVRFANGILIGMSSATETLCGQAFGAQNYEMMGVYLQRSWIINFITATVILPIYIFAPPLYKLLGQQHSIADASKDISLWFIGLIYGLVFTMTTQSYLQAQRKNMFVGLLSPVTFVFHVLISWVFVDKLGWGVAGAMGALVLSRWMFGVLMLIYVFGGWCPQTWNGFSMQAFYHLLPVFKLSISSGVMLCVQLWYNSILILLAGYTSNATVNIDAFSICLSINRWQYTICLGFVGAACVRVSNELGKGNIEAAKFAIKVILSTSMVVGAVLSALCLVLGKKIPYLFTSDHEVATAASKLLLPLAFTMLLNSFESVLSGVAIGTGLQAKVAIGNVVSYYIIGVPIGCVLAYIAHYDIMGIWIGLISGIVIQGIFLIYVTLRIDWQAEVIKTSQRLNRLNLNHVQEESEMSRYGQEESQVSRGRE